MRNLDRKMLAIVSPLCFQRWNGDNWLLTWDFAFIDLFFFSLLA